MLSALTAAPWLLCLLSPRLCAARRPSNGFGRNTGTLTTPPLLVFALPSPLPYVHPRGTYFTGKSMGVLSPDPSARTYNLTFQVLHKHNEAHKPDGIQKVAVGAVSCGPGCGHKPKGIGKVAVGSMSWQVCDFEGVQNVVPRTPSWHVCSTGTCGFRSYGHTRWYPNTAALQARMSPAPFRSLLTPTTRLVTLAPPTSSPPRRLQFRAIQQHGEDLFRELGGRELKFIFGTEVRGERKCVTLSVATRGGGLRRW